MQEVTLDVCVSARDIGCKLFGPNVFQVFSHVTHIHTVPNWPWFCGNGTEGGICSSSVITATR